MKRSLLTQGEAVLGRAFLACQEGDLGSQGGGIEVACQGASPWEEVGRMASGAPAWKEVGGQLGYETEF